MPDASGNNIVLRMMTEGGVQRISPDTMQGQVWRPLAQGLPGQRGYGQTPEEYLQGTLASYETMFDYFINVVPDPDSALSQDPNFDEKIRQQPDVHAAMRRRELTVASYPMQVIPSSHDNVDKAEAQLMADYAQDVLESLPNLPDLYRQMQNAILMGGQGHEFIWAPDGEGVMRPVWYQPVHKSRFVFDRLGNMALLTRETPVWGSYVADAPSKAGVGFQDGMRPYIIPPGKFMYHRYMAEGGPWYRPAGQGYFYYGRGEDTNLYLIVMFDFFVTRFRLRWLEKHGMPMTVIYYPDNVAKPSDIATLTQQAKKESVMLLPRSVGATGKEWFYSVDFVQPPTVGHDAFASFHETFTKPAIEKILLGGANLMQVGEVGGYNASVDQRDAGETTTYTWDALMIDSTIRHQLIAPMIRQVPRWRNVPYGHLPYHRLTPNRVRNRIVDLQILEQLAQFVPVKTSSFYDVAGEQRPKDDEEMIMLPYGIKPGERESDLRGAPLNPTTERGNRKGRPTTATQQDRMVKDKGDKLRKNVSLKAKKTDNGKRRSK